MFAVYVVLAPIFNEETQEWEPHHERVETGFQTLFGAARRAEWLQRQDPDNREHYADIAED